MPRILPTPDFEGPDPTPDELAQRKRIADRAELLDHVDYVLRPPPAAYTEMEEAIQHALAGNLRAEVKSRDGYTYTAQDLMERWELEEMLAIYRRPADDPSYDDR